VFKASFIASKYCSWSAKVAFTLRRAFIISVALSYSPLFLAFLKSCSSTDFEVSSLFFSDVNLSLRLFISFLFDIEEDVCISLILSAILLYLS